MTAMPDRERRRSPRVMPARLPRGTTVRLRAGHEAQVLNVSRHGILLESQTRLNPGQRCALHWAGPQAPANTSGVVTRAEVARRDAKRELIYRAAIDFSHPCEAFWEESTRVGNQLPMSVTEGGLAAGTKCPQPSPSSDE